MIHVLDAKQIHHAVEQPAAAAPGDRPRRHVAHGPDLFARAQQATRHAIDHLVRERGFSREEAYVICCVAADLRISEIVDAPNWNVSASLPDAICVR